MSLLKKILGQTAYWQVNKHVAKMLQSLNATVLLSELIDLDSYHQTKTEDRVNRDGKMYFYAKSDALEENTGLSYKEQKTAIEILQAFQLVETRIMGIPAKLYFTLNTDNILHLLNANIEQREILDLRFDTNSNTKNKRIKRKYQKKSKEVSVVTDTPPLESNLSSTEIPTGSGKEKRAIEESYGWANTFLESQKEKTEKPINLESVKTETFQKKPNSGGGGENSQKNVGNSTKPKKPAREWFKLSSLTEEQKGKIRELARGFDSPGDFGQSLKQWLEYKEAGEVNFRNQKINPYKNFDTMLKEVTSEAKKCKGQSEIFKQAVQHSIDKLYLGLFPEKFINENQKNNGLNNKQNQQPFTPKYATGI